MLVNVYASKTDCEAFAVAETDASFSILRGRLEFVRDSPRLFVRSKTPTHGVVKTFYPRDSRNADTDLYYHDADK